MRHTSGRRSLWAAVGAVTSAIQRKRVLRGAGQAPAEMLEARLLMARDLYVDLASPGPTHDGSSWTNAYADLQLALAAATAGDRILVADGTYKPTATTDRSISFQLKNGVSLLGGYVGFGVSNPGARDAAVFTTVLSGDIGLAGNNSDNSYHVVTGAVGVTASAVLDGFTVTGGCATGTSPRDAGGGIYLVSASPTIRGCTIAANYAVTGGGMYVANAAPQVIDCVFSANTAGSSGGGMLNTNFSATTVLNCVFSRNAASSGGGMLNANYSTPVVSRSTFFANSATGWGGGVFSGTYAAPTITSCRFIANTAGDSGGGMGYSNSGVNTLVNCVLIANSAGSYGGSISSSNESSTSLTNCTIAYNTAGYSAGGIANSATNSSTVTLTNSIVWGNRAPNEPQLSGPVTITYSDVQGGYTGTGNIDADPLFMGPPSAVLDQAWFANPDQVGDVRLSHTSPAIDAGNNAAPKLTGITVDVSGNARFIDMPMRPDTGVGTAPIVDMGAYETAAGLYVATTGPQKVRQGGEVPLAAMASSDAPGGLTFEWDYDNDGLFDDAAGASPVFSAAGFPVLTRLPVAVRVTDASGHTALASTTVTVVPAVMYVDDTAPGVNNGSSWTDAFTDLQSALLLAFSGCEIRVAGGTYRPTSTGDRLLSFRLPEGVSIYGGYAGTGTANPDARDLSLYRTVLSGDIGIAGNLGDNSMHVVVVTGSGGAAVIDGVTIAAGNANGLFSAEQDRGGGVYVNGVALTLANCRFAGNLASRGGAIYVAGPTSSAAPALINCELFGNSASNGGAVYGASAFTATNCTIVSNSASSSGGGVYGVGALANCIVWGNTALSGGQISGSATATFSSIQGGWAGTGNISADPRLVSAPWTGPDGLFGTVDDAADLHLRSNSPALNAGSNAAVPSGLATDLAGSNRIQDGIVDMGAYEGAAIAAPRVIYVDVAAPGAGTGASWVDAFRDLQSALLAARDGDIVRIGGGTYQPTATGSRAVGFALRNGVSIYGGYTGFGEPNPDARDLAVHATILSGDIGAKGVSADNSYHVVTAKALWTAIALDGVQIMYGNADGTDAAQSHGGGFLSENSSVTLSNSRFSGNLAAGRGAGLANLSSVMVVANCTFSGNSGRYGGAIYTAVGMTVTNCTIASNVSGTIGGGVYSETSAAPSLTNCIVWGNEPMTSQVYGSATVTYSDIQGGLAGTGNISKDPEFRRIPSKGADSAWGTADDNYGDLRVRPLSAVVDAADNSASPMPQMTADVLGRPRYIDIAPIADTGHGSSPVIDMGAYEAQPEVDAKVLGPLTVYLGQAVTLTAIGCGSVPGALSFAWDFDNDGDYDDASGPTPVFSTAGIPGPTTVPVRVRVTDPAGQSATAFSTITIKGTLYVDDSAAGAGDGSSWANAFRDLQAALKVATAGYEVRVAGGTYRPTTTTDRTVSFELKGEVILLGGYAGFGAANPDARDVGLYPTILSGDIGTAGDKADNSYHVVTGGSGIETNTVLDGFTITAGNANGSASFGFDCGGGMYLVYASPMVINCTFIANSAAYDGGGMFNYMSSPTITNSVFVGNSASYGGGIKNRSSSNAVVTNCTFVANTAVFYGGGVYSVQAWPTVTNSILWDNTAPNWSQIDNSANVTYSDVQDWGFYWSTGNLYADPLFARSPSAGADNTWGTADDDYGDLHLRPGSPCVDVGNSAAAGLNGVSTDASGKGRIDGGTIDMGAYELQVAPDVTSLSINDGAAQRSMVRKLVVVFSEGVVLSTDAVHVRLKNGALPANTTVTVANPSGDQRTYVMTFSGTGAVGGSLADGVYDLVVSATGVQDLAGNVLTQDYTQRFHRLFGDSDGNRIVNALDYARLKQTFGRAPTDPLFNSAFDYEGNTLINALDLARFRQRYGMSFSY